MKCLDTSSVIPAQAGIQRICIDRLGPRLRGDDVDSEFWT